jgi:hypothetical protein
MIAYKLVRKLKNGELSPLFINKKIRIPLNVWIEAEEHPTKGFSIRKGWHCTLEVKAPHLSEKDRVWMKVEVSNYEFFERPINQGGTWILAQKIKFLSEVEK